MDVSFEGPGFGSMAGSGIASRCAVPAGPSVVCAGAAVSDAVVPSGAAMAARARSGTVAEASPMPCIPGPNLDRP